VALTEEANASDSPKSCIPRLDAMEYAIGPASETQYCMSPETLTLPTYSISLLARSSELGCWVSTLRGRVVCQEVVLNVSCAASVFACFVYLVSLLDG